MDRALRIMAVLLLGLALTACGDDGARESGATAEHASQAPFTGQGIIELTDLFTGEYDLIDTDGAPVSDDAFNGQIQIIYFGFASCPDVCPLALGRLMAAMNALSEAERAAIQPVFITVDPERDTPDALADYLSGFDGIRGLTGDEEAIAKAKQSFKMYAQKSAYGASPDDYRVDHSSFYYLVDRTGKPRYALHDTLTPDHIAQLLRATLRW